MLEVLAYPFVEVCILLDLPPVLTAAATDLWNWKLKDQFQPISISNLTTITTMTGTSTEIAFHMTPCIMQVLMAPLILKIYKAPDLISQKNSNKIEKLLDEISDVIERCRKVITLVMNQIVSCILAFSEKEVSNQLKNLFNFL